MTTTKNLHEIIPAHAPGFWDLTSDLISLSTLSRDSAVCLSNYLETSVGGKIPWADLKYIFGEIMYGGHIVNDFDRLLANTYLDFYMKDELLDETEMFPFADDEKVRALK